MEECFHGEEGGLALTTQAWWRIRYRTSSGNTRSWPENVLWRFRDCNKIRDNLRSSSWSWEGVGNPCPRSGLGIASRCVTCLDRVFQWSVSDAHRCPNTSKRASESPLKPWREPARHLVPCCSPSGLLRDRRARTLEDKASGFEGRKFWTRRSPRAMR